MKAIYRTIDGRIFQEADLAMAHEAREAFGELLSLSQEEVDAVLAPQGCSTPLAVAIERAARIIAKNRIAAGGTHRLRKPKVAAIDEGVTSWSAE